MSFVHPNFLWALALLAVPILIHLFHFRRHKKVLFPNIKFLQNIQKQSTSVKKLRDLLVLIARLLALSFLVLAFAQPYIKRDNKQLETSSTVGLYIDNSFSMDRDGDQGPLIEEAKAQMRKVVQSCRPTDDFLIFTNNQSTYEPMSREEAIRYIDDIDISPQTKTMHDILRAASGQLAPYQTTKRLFYASDMQQQKELVADGELDSTVYLHLLTTKPVVASNLSIDSVWTEKPVLQLNDMVKLSIQITNHGEEPVFGNTLFLDVNEVRKSSAGFDLEANSTTTVDLDFTVNQGGWNTFKLYIEDKTIPFDDAYYGSFLVRAQFNVLILNEEKSSNYLAQIFADPNIFSVTEARLQQVDLTSIETMDLMILNGLSSLTNGITQAIEQNLQRGQNILILPNPIANDGLNDQLMALDLPTYGSILKDSLKIRQVDYEHPLYASVFKSKQPKNPSFPKVQKYVPIRTVVRSSSIVDIENGSSLLTETKKHNGAVYQLAVPEDIKWSDFFENGLAPVSLLRMPLTSGSAHPLSYTIKQSNLIKIDPELAQYQGDLQVTLNEQTWMPSVTGIDGAKFLDIGPQLSAGILKVTLKDSVVQQSALNYSRAESVSDLYDVSDIAQLFPNVHVTEVESPESFIQKEVSEQRFGQRYWKLCIALALLFLAIEILLLRFWPTGIKT